MQCNGYPESYGINIIFEDNHLLVALKPPGMLSQSDRTGNPDILSILKAYLKEKYDKPGNVYLGLVHRLDRPVGGVMIFAKTSKAASRLSEQIRDRLIKKVYLAVIDGEMASDSGRLDGWMIKDNDKNISDIVDKDTKNARYASLLYNTAAKTESEGQVMSLLVIELITGRAHQIRVQFANEGHYIIGDRKYGKNRGIDSVPVSPALWAYKLEFEHPVKKERVSFSAAPPINVYPWSKFPFLDL